MKEIHHYTETHADWSVFEVFLCFFSHIQKPNIILFHLSWWSHSSLNRFSTAAFILLFTPSLLFTVITNGHITSFSPSSLCFLQQITFKSRTHNHSWFSSFLISYLQFFSGLCLRIEHVQQLFFSISLLLFGESREWRCVRHQLIFIYLSFYFADEVAFVESTHLFVHNLEITHPNKMVTVLKPSPVPALINKIWLHEVKSVTEVIIIIKLDYYYFRKIYPALIPRHQFGLLLLNSTFPYITDHKLFLAHP